ncbi:MAG TPA: MFS transporter, partial [Alphaproteobacteria bacterium]|nr:MFS transporter [Alphaproteobacteria bacterium]
ILPTALLWYAEPDRSYAVYALTLVVIANIAFELGGVFYNAMLPSVAPRSMIGRVSGWGWGFGYAGGLVCLVVALFGLIQTDTPVFGFSSENAENVRATALLVAVWYGVFGLPLLLFTRDEPSTGIGPFRAMRQGLAVLGRTLREVRRYGQVARFLVASALYRDGLNTLFIVGGLYAAGTFGMSTEEIIVFAIGLNVTAGLGAAGFAFLDDRIGPKPTILIALIGLILTGLPLLLVSSTALFTGFALVLGIFVGPAQAASRSLMAHLAPADMEAEMFGLYAMTGKAIAFLGPIAFAQATAAFDSQRAGMSTILIFLALGGLVLLTVKPPARPPSPNGKG